MKAALALILLFFGCFFLYEVFTNQSAAFLSKFQAGAAAAHGGTGASFGK